MLSLESCLTLETSKAKSYVRRPVDDNYSQEKAWKKKDEGDTYLAYINK